MPVKSCRLTNLLEMIPQVCIYSVTESECVQVRLKTQNGDEDHMMQSRGKENSVNLPGNIFWLK